MGQCEPFGSHYYAEWEGGEVKEIVRKRKGRENREDTVVESKKEEGRRKEGE